ncbi:MAG: putative DNA binding domain-containing protein [Anaerolineae bacterium]|nr:putative DNA binding domain-containing protein [Anaerolineae bacterium]
MASRKKTGMQWYRVDLHLHTPASSDYQEPTISYLDILRKAEFRGLDIIAFTDHNTVAGYAAMLQEIDQLGHLESLGRAQPDELRTLAEYRRLLEKVLVLPGFEFTATFGFHILGIFSPDTPIRQLEHLLLNLNVPLETLDTGSSNVGASSDVLTAYRVITEAGGICIAAHANTTHGVAMRGLDFGGQTRIAYTQDSHLHALEVTDLTNKGRGSTQRFFSGTKPEYPRRMRCIQGSDAHRLNVAPGGEKNKYLGVGDRVTEVLMEERSFDSLLGLFKSSDFSRSKAFTGSPKPYDYVEIAREEGPSVIQAFHDSMTRRGGRLYSIVADVCAFANGNGGTIYVGVTADRANPPVGVGKVQEAIDTLNEEISRMITPALEVEIDTLESQGKQIIRLQVSAGDDRPYAIEDYKIYVRDDAETSLAVRDEIVSLITQGQVISKPTTADTEDRPAETGESSAPPVSPPPDLPDGEISPPRGGVEIIGTEQRNNMQYHVLRDLRNGNIVKNVTRSSARRLWHYAISQKESNPVKLDKVQWQGDIGLWRRYQKAGEARYDLVQRGNGNVRVYYGVTESGMHGPWQAFLGPDDEE